MVFKMPQLLKIKSKSLIPIDLLLELNEMYVHCIAQYRAHSSANKYGLLCSKGDDGPSGQTAGRRRNGK